MCLSCKYREHLRVFTESIKLLSFFFNLMAKASKILKERLSDLNLCVDTSSPNES